MPIDASAVTEELAIFKFDLLQMLAAAVAAPEGAPVGDEAFDWLIDHPDT